MLDLPGLSAKEIEAFCERAVRKFHFRPKYMIRKAVQAVTDPTEGMRSINAFKNFVLSLTSGERASVAPVLPANAAAVDEQWGSRVRVPRGRMEQVGGPS